MNHKRRRPRRRPRDGYDTTDAVQVRRETQPEDRPIKTKNKRPRPFLLESRWRLWGYDTRKEDWGPWRKAGAYRTERERDEALRHLSHALERLRKWIEYRVAP